jgi:hypothetical protein
LAAFFGEFRQQFLWAALAAILVSFASNFLGSFSSYLSKLVKAFATIFW